jgi:hypothetical protein
MANYDPVGAKSAAVFPDCIGQLLAVNYRFINPRNMKEFVDNKAGRIRDVRVKIKICAGEYCVG